MREPERDPGRLVDMIEAADCIASYTEGFTREELLADKLRYHAVSRNVEIIGEAAYMLTQDFKDKHSVIPWSDVIGMRHVLVHGYASILPEILWDVALNDVPKLKQQIQAIIKSAEVQG